MMALEPVHLHKNEKIPGPGGLNLRRNSIGKTDSGDSKENVISRYLRASIASCHDFCKYGTKEAFDVKERSLIPMRVLRKSFDGKNIQQTGSNNSSVAKFRMSFASKSQLCNGHDVNQHGISTKSNFSQMQSRNAVLKNQKNTTKSSGTSEGVRGKGETLKLKSTWKPLSTCGSLKESGQQLRAPLSTRSPLKGVASISARHWTLRYCSHLKNQRHLKQYASQEQNNDEVEEKTLYVIESGKKPDRPPSVEYSSSFSEPLSLQDQEGSNFAIDGPDDVTFLANNATADVYNRKSANKHCMGDSGKDGSNCCDDKDNQLLKLSFTRGRIVDMHSDNNSSRKLIFKSGRIMGQNTSLKADPRRRSSKMGSGVDGDAMGTAAGPKKVALKHQEVEEKKESKGLLNNVIEKTASELVKSQMSRVKALVGAFETLISLQQGKTSTSTVKR